MTANAGSLKYQKFFAEKTNSVFFKVFDFMGFLDWTTGPTCDIHYSHDSELTL